MRVLFVNKFFFQKGGAENSFLSAVRLIKEKGHDVSVLSMAHPRNIETEYSPYFVSNVDLQGGGGLLRSVMTAGRILYSFEAKRKIAKLADKTSPDIAHLSNIYHQISPSIIDALKSRNVPVVMTLHDYKMSCPAYTHLSPKGICEECSNGRYYRAVANRCIKDSRLKSALCAAEMYLHHLVLRIYDKVDVFIAPSRFLMEKVREMGFKGSLVHLPNFVFPSDYEPSYQHSEESITYFGRLSHEKGLKTLISAVKGLPLSLKIIGEGPEREELEAKVEKEGIGNVYFLGYKSGTELTEEIKKSMFTVVPSEWFENMPRSIIESFALGKPVVGSRVGGIVELVKDGEAGITFDMGRAEDLRDKIVRLSKDAEGIEAMGRRGRRLAEEIYSPDHYYRGIREVYKKAGVKI
jgi:glycosyltransferase involved in cell wall biosynthesis